MCGIAGILALGDAERPLEERLRSMAGRVSHRGPDQEGVLSEDGVGFAVRRLAVIDPEHGHQPASSEDGTVRVVLNGEIYNHRELRAELERDGHRFRTRSDTEVLAELWRKQGPDCLERLDGMFAFAVHDLPGRRVHLVRDPMGIKPLFWARSGRHLVFGSEVKALLASGLIDRELDLDALSQYLAWEYVPAPATLFRAVRKLEPGHRLEVDLARVEIGESCYWSLPARSAESDPKSPAEWEDAVDGAIASAVRRQLVSDVPLGTMLSGGVDSSLVAAGMGEGRAFTLGFEDPSYDELPWARRVADHLGLEHVHETLAPATPELFEELAPVLDDPIGDTSIFPTALAFRFARHDVTVALTGDGGDELFGGYDTHVAQQVARAWTLIPGPLRRSVLEPLLRALPPAPQKKGLRNAARRFAEGLTHDEALGHARWRLFVGEATRKTLLTPEARAAATTPLSAHVQALADQARAAGRDHIDSALFVDFRSYLVDNCLVKVDRMSMASSLEARVPLLDRNLVELAFRLPSYLKLQRRRSKILLKRVAARHVPRECIERPKQGFSSPVKHWLRSELRPRMDALLSQERLAVEGLFQPATVELLRREHLAGRADHSHVLWPLLVFQDWRERWAA